MNREAGLPAENRRGAASSSASRSRSRRLPQTQDICVLRPQRSRRSDGCQPRLLAALEVALELAPGEAVDDAALLDPGSPGLGDAKLREGEGHLVVGVGV